MTDRLGYYSLIQYCPNAARAETLNVGVILLVPASPDEPGKPDIPGWISTRILQSNARLQRAFGVGLTLNHIDAMKQSVVDRITTEYYRFLEPSYLTQYAQTRGNEIIITLPRTIKIEIPSNWYCLSACMRELDRLFEELVKYD